MTKTGSSSDAGNDLLNQGYLIAAAVVICVAIIVGSFIWRFHSFDFSASTEHWGQFGDFVGGLVNPLVGVATVLLVLINIRIQQKELKASLEQIKHANVLNAKQSFEQSLFAWLGTYRQLVDNIRDEDGTTGKLTLAAWHRKNFASDTPSPSHQSSIATIAKTIERGDYLEGKMDLQTKVNLFIEASKGYEKIFESKRSDLDAVLRTLYRLFLWIDTSTLSNADKRHYASLVRAQLSWIEMVYLVFNGLTSQGENFAVLCNRYALFDNLAVNNERVLEIIKCDIPNLDKVDLKTMTGFQHWPYDKSAFSSDVAWTKLENAAT